MARYSTPPRLIGVAFFCPEDKKNPQIRTSTFMNKICLNGKIFPSDEPVLMATNRGYRYGDGLFETMKVLNLEILLEAFHFERLFSGLSLLKISIPGLFTREKLREQILHLCERNECGTLARVRLSVFRGNGGLYDENKGLEYLVECWPLDESVNQLNENGLVLGVYPPARKSCDVFANLKSANFLPYTMAAQFAKENKWNDCLVLNTYERICDATIANLFIIKDGIILTPPLSEGCVNGVMRRRILESGSRGLDLESKVEESALTIEDILNADEVFLTNAINGIRWVRQFMEKTYSNSRTISINNQLVQM
jgi:branched-chain amino acid aminotransferase